MEPLSLENRPPGQPISDFRLESVFPSDALVGIREFVSKVPALKPILKELAQLLLVIDADIIQREIRWRAGKRRNPSARSSFQEAIDSGVVVAVAPTHLKSEIEEHLADIAADVGVATTVAQRHWDDIQRGLFFYTPKAEKDAGDLPDPDDLAYKQACEELGAVAVYSGDSHFRSMNVPVISAVDLTLRKHARANSIAIGVELTSGTTFIIGFETLRAIFKLMRKSVDAFGRLPSWVQLATGIAALVALVHPKSRAKLAVAWQSTCSALKAAEPSLAGVVVQIGNQFLTAKAAASETYAEIQAVLPKPRRRSALTRARSICVTSHGPLPLREIERRIRSEGYLTRAKNFQSYLRRLLRESQQFVETSPGVWALHGIQEDRRAATPPQNAHRAS